MSYVCRQPDPSGGRKVSRKAGTNPRWAGRAVHDLSPDVQSRCGGNGVLVVPGASGVPLHLPGNTEARPGWPSERSSAV